MTKCQEQRSVFGGVISYKQISSNYGYRRLESNRNILDTGVESLLRSVLHISELESNSSEITFQNFIDTCLLIVDLVLADNPGLDYFRSNPHEELGNFANLVYQSKARNTQIKLVSSTCPDYEPRSYLLRDGIGIFAERTIEGFTKVKNTFSKFGVDPKLELHLADGDLIDPVALRLSGESESSFSKKISTSVEKISNKVADLKMENIDISVMSSLFESGLSGYSSAHSSAKEVIKKLHNDGNRRVRSAIANLKKERIELGDFDSISNPDVQNELVIGELAGYLAYGQVIGSSAPIISPGAMSVVSAYNFGKSYSQVSPIIYIYGGKGK